jgi:NSS family neurotransmitter:Na+ symporter
VGWLGILAGFVILSYYSVVGGWIFNYITSSVISGFETGLAAERFQAFMTSPSQQIAWHGLFMLATILIVRGGISSGIERWTKLLMPALFLILVVLTVMGLMSPGAGRALRFLFEPDFSQLTRAGFLEALGSAFFSLSLGMGAMLTYGSYLDKSTNISSAALEITALDTFFSIMAGVMIFPIVFSYGVDPSAGPGLFFVTLPEIFAQMPGGRVCGFFFFVLVGFAALTSAISLLEVVVAFFIDELNWSRKRADYTLGAIIFVCGIPSALSFNLWSGFTLMGGKNIFDLLDGLATNVLLPLGGLGIAVFAGWILTHGEKEAEIKNVENAFHFYDVWHVLVKYVTPVALAIVLLYTTGIMEFIGF